MLFVFFCQKNLGGLDFLLYFIVLFCLVVCMGWTICVLNVGPFGPTQDYSHMGALYRLFCIERAGLIKILTFSADQEKKNSYVFGLMFYWLNNANGMVVLDL